MSEQTVSVDAPWGLKLGLGLAIGAVGAYFLLPILLKMVLTAATIAIVGVAGLALWFFYPAMIEGLAQASFMSYEMAIRGNPIAKLKRELAAFQRDIGTMETNMATAMASVDSVKELFRREKANLNGDDIEEFQQNILFGEQACKDMQKERDRAVLECQQFERTVKSAEAKYKLSGALRKCLGPLAFDKKSGANTQGSQIALDQVQAELSASRQKLGLMLSRPTVQQQMDSKREQPLLANTNVIDVVPTAVVQPLLQRR